MNMDEARARFDGFWRYMITVEVPAHREFLPAEEAEAFGKYYQRLPAPSDEASIRHFLRGGWRADAGWTARWLAARNRPKVLDAGSGFGTYAMLYASVGAEVTAVDLRPDRLSAADRRIDFHAQKTGQRLAVRNIRADLTREWDQRYDLVWVYNALSHIDPLDPFLHAVRDHLTEGGVLVVGDINGANPEHLRRLNKLRTTVHQEYVAPDGERHTYAVERPFPPGEVREIMERNGLRVLHHELYWRGMASVPDPLYRAVMQPLQSHWRWGQNVARRQLVVAGRSDGSA